MNLPSELRWAIRHVWCRLFDVVFFDPWYRTHRHAPKYIYSDDPWMIEHWEENLFDPICFPLPLKINCVGCVGCAHNHNPFLQPDLHKGPYIIQLTENFESDYKEMFGDEALKELQIHVEELNKETKKQQAIEMRIINQE